MAIRLAATRPAPIDRPCYRFHGRSVEPFTARNACSPYAPSVRSGYTFGRWAVPLVTALLAACGGGSGEAPAGPTAPTISPPEAEVEFRSFMLVNDSRLDQGVEPQLGLDELLSEVARRHSRAMRDQGFYSHRDPQGRSVSARLREAGIRFSDAGENIVQVDRAIDPAALAHGELMASPPHRANIMGGGYQVIGVGVARLGGTYWITQIFVAP